MNKLCECGCGQSVKNRFVRGHNSRGKNHPLYGKKHSAETRKKISRARIGKHPPPETKRKMSMNHADVSGENHPMWGKHRLFSLETREKMSKSHIGLQAGKNNPMYGKHRSAETKRKISIAQSGENNPNFGRSPPKGSGTGRGSYCRKGHWVRSTWERKIADWLFDENIEYQYEPERFVFNSRISYLPDFYIPQCDLYLEVKGYMRSKNKIQHKLFVQKGYRLLVIDKSVYSGFEKFLLTSLI